MSKAEPPVDVSLPITPMLDMSFQLLAFFILTFHPMAQEGQLAINLPKPDATNITRVDEDQIDKKDEYTIQVHSSSGEIELLSLQGPTVKRDALKFGELQAELQGLPKPSGKGKNGISITIEAADKLNYARLMDVMNLCKHSGYDSIGIGKIK